MVKHLKKLIAVIIAVAVLSSVCMVGTISPNAAGTGAGLAEWALTAYYEGWSYVWGGASRGAVDCSGLIYSYSPTGSRTEMVSTAQEWGYVSSGIPRVHGLGLHQPGHYGVYVGNGMAVDARGTDYGVCYESASSKAWVEWFKVCGVSYPTTGWVKFNGEYFYYENGQYVVNTSRNIGGTTYSFSSSGASDKTPDDMSAVANSSGSGNSGNSGGSGSSGSSGGSSSKKSSSSSTPSAPKVLKLGSSGDKVTKLQNRLTELGYYHDAVTGYFGEATERAFKKFQKTAGLVVDGIAGSDLDILYSDSAPSAPVKKSKKKAETKTEDETQETEEEKTSWQLGDQGDKVVEIQNRLAELNYYNEESTGYFGEITESSLVAFQNASGIDPTGVADANTIYALFLDDAAVNPLYEEEEETEEEEAVETEEAVYEEYEKEASYEETPSEEMTVYEIAEDNAETAENIIVKTNKISKKALASAVKSDEKSVSISAEEQKNSDFVFWIFVVVALAFTVSGVFFVINRRRPAASGARVKSKKNEKMTVRYW